MNESGENKNKKCTKTFLVPCQMTRPNQVMCKIQGKIRFSNEFPMKDLSPVIVFPKFKFNSLIQLIRNYCTTRLGNKNFPSMTVITVKFIVVLEMATSIAENYCQCI